MIIFLEKIGKKCENSSFEIRKLKNQTRSDLLEVFSSGPYIEKIYNLAKKFFRVPGANFMQILVKFDFWPLYGQNYLYDHLFMGFDFNVAGPFLASKGPATLKSKPMKRWSYRPF